MRCSLIGCRPHERLGPSGSPAIPNGEGLRRDNMNHGNVEAARMPWEVAEPRKLGTLRQTTGTAPTLPCCVDPLPCTRPHARQAQVHASEIVAHFLCYDRAFTARSSSDAGDP
jgi:hypothetical protein